MDDKCPNDPQGIHQPNWVTCHATSDGGKWYIDVNCELCGQSGCVGSESSYPINLVTNIDEYGFVVEKPSTPQAITWLSYRRQTGIEDH